MGQWYYNLVLAVNFLSAIAVIVLVLLQHGKGADMGASFGSGSSGSLFGATGTANLLSRTTAILAIVFFTSCLALAWIGIHAPRTSSSIMLQGDALKKDGKIDTVNPAIAPVVAPKVSDTPASSAAPVDKSTAPSSQPAIPK